MTTAWIVSAAHRRFDVTRLVLQQRQRLCVELAGRGIQASMLIAGDDENLDIAREHGAATLEAPNEPLAQKCNAALLYAAERADWVVWVGSDDWIHPDAFDPLLRDTSGDEDQRPRIVVGLRLAMVDVTTGQLQPIKQCSKYGAIPWLIDSRLLRTSRGPIRPDLESGMDGALVRGLRLTQIGFQFEKHDTHYFRCVDFKTRENLSPFAGVQRNLGESKAGAAGPVLREWFPGDLVDQAERLFEEAQFCATR